VPPAPVALVVFPPQTGWHVSGMSIPDTHKSRLLALAGIVAFIGSWIGGSFPRAILTVMLMFLVVSLPVVGAAAVPPPPAAAAPPSVLNVNVSGVPPAVAPWSVVPAAPPSVVVCA
jgi:hypothetical protein